MKKQFDIRTLQIQLNKACAINYDVAVEEQKKRKIKTSRKDC